MTTLSIFLSLEEFVDGAAWATLQQTSPTLARDVAVLVRSGEPPAKIAAFARRKGATPLIAAPPLTWRRALEQRQLREPGH